MNITDMTKSWLSGSGQDGSFDNHGLIMSSMWFNVYREKQGQEKHDHSSHVGQTVPFWSGIYYNKNASPTKFFKSNSIITDTQKFDGYRESALASCLAKSVSPDAKDGDILLFPPYLKHSVKSKPQHKNEMRMTFSFNITLKSFISEPTSVITPAPSAPIPAGSFKGYNPDL